MSQSAATAWFAAGLFGLFLFWTVVTVPYESLGPEITFDYQERVGLFALRDGLLIAGTLAAAASPTLAREWLGSGGRTVDERDVFFWISVFYAPLIVATAWVCVAVVRERPLARPMAREPLLSGLRQVAANRPFLILLAAYTVSAVGNNLPATLILYYVQYVLQSPHADFFLLLYFVTGILFLPAWTALARRLGKKHAWLMAMAVNTGAFAASFSWGRGMRLPTACWCSCRASVSAPPWPFPRPCRPMSSITTNCSPGADGKGSTSACGPSPKKRPPPWVSAWA
jgi:GPH family glycoside/pentoside/hexuronide:cation symporter